MLLVVGKNQYIVEKAFNIELKDGTTWLKGVVSRKKQVVPFLMAAIQSLEE